MKTTHLPLLALALGSMSSTAWAQRYECATSLGVNCSAGIAERGTSTSTLTVLPGDCDPTARIVDVSVHTKVAHTSVGDLSMTLTHPSGRSVQFFYRPGLSSTTPACVYDDLDGTFSDDAPTMASCAFTIPAVSGTMKPFNALSVFDGLDRNGTWTLTVSDLEGGGSGSLLEWALELPCTLPPRAVVNVATGTRDSVEGSGVPASFVFTRDDATATLVVPYTLGGDALPGLDYDRPMGTVTFAAGEASVTLEVLALEDGLAETTESVEVLLGSGAFTAGPQRRAGINLVDVTCGDGVKTGPETCDDGNQRAGDGCSDTCTAEAEKPKGCGCTGADAGLALMAALVLLRRRGGR